jgi:hypothetical protein
MSILKYKGVTWKMRSLLQLIPLCPFWFQFVAVSLMAKATPPLAAVLWK